MKKWRLERGWDPNNPARRFFAVEACEHIVVLNKRDLVPEWGLDVGVNHPQSRNLILILCYCSLFVKQWKRSFPINDCILHRAKSKTIYAF